MSFLAANILNSMWGAESTQVIKGFPGFPLAILLGLVVLEILAIVIYLCSVH